MNELIKFALLTCCCVLGLAILLSLIRAFRGPRFTDRIVGVNMIGTITIAIMAILSVAMDADFLIDISIVYALLSFIAIVVLTRLVIIRRRGQLELEGKTDPENLLGVEEEKHD